MKQQRNILIDVTHTLSHPHNTGVQRVVRRLAVWARHWQNTTFIRFDRHLQDFVPLAPAEIDFLIEGWTKSLPLQSEPNQGGFRKLARSLPGAQAAVDFFRSWRTTLAFDFRPRQVDFLNAVYFSAEVFGEADRTAALAWWLKKGSTKVVLVVHDLIPYVHPEWSIFNPRHFENYLFILRRSSALAAVSHHTKDQVTRWFNDHKQKPPRIETIRPGFDLPTTKPDTPERATGLGRFFVCVGTIEIRKNQLRVLQSLESLWDEGREFSFVFAGKEAEGGEDFRDAWEKLVTAGYPVRWWNPATEAEVEWLYTHALATVYPSLAEGFGLPVVESLARGTPCVTSSWGATGETATDLGGCLMVDPTDEKAIQDALRRLLDEPDLRTELIQTFQRGKIRLWEDFARDLQALVEEMAD